MKSERQYSRRSFTGFLIGSLTGASLPFGSCRSPKNRDKREAIFNLIQGGRNEDYIPCGFFVHFGKDYHFGDAAINRHLEYFEAIDMDFIKVQYEASFPPLDHIQKPEDWLRMPLYGKDYYEKQLYVVRELVKRGKNKAPVIATLYSPFMSAGHTVSDEVLTHHMLEDPERVKSGLEIITESTLIFVKECVKAGVDGFLASTQGGEAFRFKDKSIFPQYVKPIDLVIMEEINKACTCNVLHICDYVGGYDDLSPFLDYPGHIVNCSMKINDREVTAKDIREWFQRPVFGGLEKRGPIAGRDPDLLKKQVIKLLQSVPDQFILGAECALLGDIDWKMVRLAVDMAHGVVS